MDARRSLLVLSMLSIAILLATGIAIARGSAQYTISPDVIANGGGPMSSAHYSLDATAGQVAVGVSSSSQYRAVGGYWEGGGVQGYVRYLPLISK